MDTITMSRSLERVVVAPDAGRRIVLGPVQMRVLDDGRGSGGAVALAAFWVPPHVYTTPLHVHQAHDEGFYVLEGRLEFLLGAATRLAGPGTYVAVPRGVAHTFRNPGPEPARFLNTFAPPRYLAYFDELSALLAGPAAADPAARRLLMARYATDVVAP
jgi:mannose-6-phosphate isomerase-like protein (cupin superfamily)